MRRPNDTGAQCLLRVFGCAVLLFSSLPSKGSAAELSGEGIFFTQGRYGAAWEASDTAGNWSFDTKTRYAGTGLLLDITAENFLFRHQRLRMGYEKLTSTINNCTSGCRLELEGYIIEHVVRFEITKQGHTAFWIGPEVRLSRSSGSPGGTPELNVTLWGTGIGVETGVDIALDKYATLVLQGGYLWRWYRGEGSAPAYAADYDIEESHPFYVVSLFFRL